MEEEEDKVMFVEQRRLVMIQQRFFLTLPPNDITKHMWTQFVCHLQSVTSQSYIVSIFTTHLIITNLSSFLLFIFPLLI